MVTRPLQTPGTGTRGGLAESSVKHAKALEALIHRHSAESSDQVTTLLQEVVVP